MIRSGYSLSTCVLGLAMQALFIVTQLSSGQTAFLIKCVGVACSYYVMDNWQTLQLSRQHMTMYPITADIAKHFTKYS